MATRTTLLRPGLTPYEEAWQLQQQTAQGVRAGELPALILLQHPPVYTLGVRGNSEHILARPGVSPYGDADVVRSDRGGDVTFHGPGQIVAYPIMNLRALGNGPVWYVRTLEAVILDVLSCFGIVARRIAGRPGVWVQDAKVAAIGVRVSGGVTTHGFALNVSTELEYFRHIIPCGLADATVTSMQELTGECFALTEVEDQILESMSRHFDLEFQPPSKPAAVPAVQGAGYGR